MLCTCCKTPVPTSATCCPTCGTATPLDLDATAVVTPDSEQTVLSTGVGKGWSKAYTTSDDLAYRAVSIKTGAILGGRYEILEMLGEGGMGSVFKARDREVDRIVALKVIRSELAGSEDILKRFRQELILTRKVTHRNVVRIFDLGVADGLRFISMEYIDGRELAHILHDQGKLPPKEAAEIILQVCKGLAVAHSEGVIHRDLKPQNIMIDKQRRAAVMDFGIAHSEDAVALIAHRAESGSGAESSLTHVGSLLGTPRYMSPEQSRGGQVDKRSDLFTVGLIFYEMLTGDVPADKTSLADLLRIRSEQQIKAPIDVDPRIPRPLNDIIVRCLQLEPAKRYHSADQIIHDLEIWLGIRKRHTANWKLLAAAAVLIVILAAALFYNLRPRTAVTHAPVKILISDFANATGNAVLTGTLEPLLSTDLEGASFITAFNRGDARKTLAKLTGSNRLDENSARLVARREGVGVVIAGSINRDGDAYRISAQAVDTVSGKVIDKQTANASKPEQLNIAVAKIAAGFRKALGDVVSKSKQIAAAETFSSQSLAASQQYAQAQELQWAGKWDEALKAYALSAHLDPGLGRAYAGMAVILANMGRRKEAETYFRLAMSKIDRMSDREKYRTRGGYYLLERDYENAIEQFKALEKQYPADSAGIANLALADFYARNMSAALEEGRRAVAIYPNNLLQLNNVALFAMYAGDFDTAIRDSQQLLKMNPSFEKAYICLGLSQFAEGNVTQAAQTYKKLGTLGDWGASASTIGLADMALFEARPRDAIPLLEHGLDADAAAHNNSRFARKWIMLAQAWLMSGQKEKAISAAEEASVSASDEDVLYPAAIVLLETGRSDRTLQLAHKLAQRFEPDPQAYAKLIDAELQMKKRDYRGAVRTFQDARKIADTWLGRLGLGRAYLEAGAFTDADTEFDACLKRRGEATAVFLDDEPSWRYFAPLYYYLGRTREGLGSPDAADAYRNYLNIRENSTDDPLAKDARKRLRSLETSRSANR